MHATLVPFQGKNSQRLAFKGQSFMNKIQDWSFPLFPPKQKCPLMYSRATSWFDTPDRFLIHLYNLTHYKRWHYNSWEQRALSFSPKGGSMEIIYPYYQIAEVSGLGSVEGTITTKLIEKPHMASNWEKCKRDHWEQITKLQEPQETLRQYVSHTTQLYIGMY